MSFLSLLKLEHGNLISFRHFLASLWGHLGHHRRSVGIREARGFSKEAKVPAILIYSADIEKHMI